MSRSLVPAAKTQPLWQPVHGLPELSERPPKTIGPVAPSSSGDRHHDGGFNRHKPPVRSSPLFKRLQFRRMGRYVGNIELRQHLLCRVRVVVRRSSYQGETRQRHQRVDDRAAVLQEELLDRGPGIRPYAKAGITRKPRASSASITPS